jgi:hypothetical protein
MPGFASTDINVVSPENSFVGNLGPNAFFTGVWIDVTDYTTITVSAAAPVPPAPNDAIIIDWSDDGGITLHNSSVFGSDADISQTAHSTVHSKWARVRYHAPAGGVVGAHVQTLLRKGPISGSVSRVGLITGAPDAQDINAVTMGKATTTYQAVKAIPDTITPTDYYLGIDQPVRRTPVFQISTPANLSSVQLDFAGIGALTRRWLEIYNDTVKGNLFVRLGSAASLVNYHFRIPSQHIFVLPISWPMYGGTGGTVFGIWDIADGTAHMNEGA